jgi:hypothetical protein
MAIWCILWSFGIFLPVFLFCTKKNLATMAQRFRTGLPDFYRCNIPKRNKIYQITVKYTEWPRNITNCHKIYKKAINKTNDHKI